MDSLGKIQRFSKVGLIFSEIAFISSMVGALGSMIGLMSLSVGNGSTVRIGNLVLNSLFDIGNEEDINAMCVSLVTWLVICAGSSVLAWFAKSYFSNELMDGTPFNKESASELRRLGILVMVIPILTSAIASAVQFLVAEILQVSSNSYIEVWDGDDFSVMLGITFLILSFIFRYGAEELEKASSSRSNDFMNMV